MALRKNGAQVWSGFSEKKRYTRCPSQQFREDDLDGVEPV